MAFGLNSVESRNDRFRRSTLLKADVRQNSKFEIKIADKFSEWESSFKLLYEEYLNAGYVVEPTPSNILFGIHHFLPKTVVFIAKYSDALVSSLTQFFDNHALGLPADKIYKEELDTLRAEGRVISEIGGLVTRKDFRWQNLFLCLCQVMYWHSHFRKIDDLCITVNPKHVRFYKTVFLFEIMGQEKYYAKVNAPAVLMRLNLRHSEKKLQTAYNHLEVDCNLYDYFHKMDGDKITDYSTALKKKKVINGGRIPQMDTTIVETLISRNTDVLENITLNHATYLNSLYPEVFGSGETMFAIHNRFPSFEAMRVDSRLEY